MRLRGRRLFVGAPTAAGTGSGPRGRHDVGALGDRYDASISSTRARPQREAARSLGRLDGAGVAVLPADACADACGDYSLRLRALPARRKQAGLRRALGAVTPRACPPRMGMRDCSLRALDANGDGNYDLADARSADASASHQLSYAGASTALLWHGASPTALENALNALSTVGSARVRAATDGSSSAASACVDDGSGDGGKTCTYSVLLGEGDRWESLQLLAGLAEGRSLGSAGASCGTLLRRVSVGIAEDPVAAAGTLLSGTATVNAPALSTSLPMRPSRADCCTWLGSALARPPTAEARRGGRSGDGHRISGLRLERGHLAVRRRRRKRLHVRAGHPRVLHSVAGLRGRLRRDPACLRVHSPRRPRASRRRGATLRRRLADDRPRLVRRVVRWCGRVERRLDHDGLRRRKHGERTPNRRGIDSSSAVGSATISSS